MSSETEQNKGIYVSRVLAIARDLKLDSLVFPFDIQSNETSEEFIIRCCKLTGTELQEQLKFTLASDIDVQEDEMGHPVVGVIRYCDKFDFKRLGQVTASAIIYAGQDIKPNRFSPHRVNPNLFGIKPGYIGFNEMMYTPTSPGGERWDGEGKLKVPYVVDSKIRELRKICFPAGKGDSVELVMVSSNSQLGESLDSLLTGIVGDPVLFENISK